MEFVHAAKNEGLPKIVSIQNNYSLLVRCKFESKWSVHIIIELLDQMLILSLIDLCPA